MSNPADNPWDVPGINQRLRELHALKGADELSMTEIAEQLNREFKTEFTRNSIIGRCHRINLARRPSVFNVHHAKRRQEKMIPINRRVRVDAPIVPEMPVADPAAGITILQLSPGACRWPLGDLMTSRPPYLFCGKVAMFDGPYCPAHHDRACGKPIARAV
jgi:hypothetical protein